MSTEHPLLEAPPPPLRVVTTVEVMVTPLVDGSDPRRHALVTAERLHAAAHRAIQAVTAAGPLVRITDGDVHTLVVDEQSGEEITAW